MATNRRHAWMITPLAVGALLLAGCSSDDSGDGGGETSSPASEETSEPGAETTEPDEGSSTSEDSGGDDECYIHLFDADDFDETDDNFKLTEPGEYEDLSDLPGADQDWTDEADSAKVGGSATVTVWSETNFGGDEATLDPGSEHASLDPEPSSLKMTC